jgi:hypothetical protein
MFDLVVTNVPGPQLPLYAAGARMTEIFPMLPLSEGQALSIALTSYDGGLYYGITADRDAVPDVAAIGELVTESLAELVAAGESGAATRVRERRPTGRSSAVRPAGPRRAGGPRRNSSDRPNNRRTDQS